jgi:CheY-like chemotaxis protein
MKILLVEDDIDNQDLISNLLSFYYPNNNILLASSVNEAISLLQHNPDVIITDINLEQSSGFVLIKHIRQSSTIPIIAISSNPILNKEAIKLGANKAFQKTELIEIIKNNLLF